MNRIRPRVPAPLCALLACVALLGLAWTLAVPPWQSPDEAAHTAFVQSLAERGSLPVDGGQMMSTEQLTASRLANTFQTTGALLTDPEWSPRLAARYERLRDLQRDDGGGGNPAGSNPPLYYLYETIPYRVASGGDIWSRMLAMRLASMLWLLVTVAGAWLLAGQLFHRDRRLQLVAAGCTGLLPMVMFISSSVNPDAMLIALWTLALWLGAATLRERSWRAGVALGLVTGLAIVTKSTSYALVPAVLLVFAVTALRTRPGRSALLTARSLLLALTALAIPVAAWIVVARATEHPVSAQVASTATSAAGGATNLREFFSYLWQFYLPALPTQADFQASHPDFQPTSDALPLYATWIRTGWAAFGYLEVQFPNPVYWVLATASGATVLAFLVSLRGRLRQLDWATAAFFACVALALLAGLHWTEYHTLQTGGAGFTQGRYLLPLAALGGIAVAQATRLVPATRRGVVHAAVLGSLAVLQLFALGLVMARYYA